MNIEEKFIKIICENANVFAMSPAQIIDGYKGKQVREDVKLICTDILEGIIRNALDEIREENG